MAKKIQNKVKEKGILNLGGVNKLANKVKKQQPKKKKDKLGLSPLPDSGTGIGFIPGAGYK